MKAPQQITISTSTFVKAVLIVLGLWFLWFIRDIVAIFVIALLLAALIDPFAHWLAERRIPRALAVLIVYTVLLSITSIMLILMVPVVIEQSGQLIANMTDSSLDLSNQLTQLRRFSESYGLADNLAASLQAVQQSVADSVGSIFSTVKGVAGAIAAVFLVLVLTFYMVVEEDAMRKYFKHLAPAEYQPYMVHITKRMQEKMGAWLRGQIILGLIVGLSVYIGLTLLGVEYALLLALLAGIFEMVPYVGPIISVIPAAIISFAQSPILGGAVLALYLIIQQIENHVLVPKIMQKVTGLNPIVSILALLVGIKVGGLVGGIIAIPLATMLLVVVEDLFRDVD